MNRGHLQIIAEKVSSTIRVLELLQLEYTVSAPKRERVSGNQCPRVVHTKVGSKSIRIYNSKTGNTWATESDGTPISDVKSVESLHFYLSSRKKLEQQVRNK